MSFNGGGDFMIKYLFVILLFSASAFSAVDSVIFGGPFLNELTIYPKRLAYSLSDGFGDLKPCKHEKIDKCIILFGMPLAMPFNEMFDNFEVTKDHSVRIFRFTINNVKFMSLGIPKTIKIWGVERKGHVFSAENSDWYYFVVQGNGIVAINHKGSSFISYTKCGLFAPVYCTNDT